MEKTILYNIKMGRKYLQKIEPTENYVSSGKAPIMGRRYSIADFRSVWGSDPVGFEMLTANSYISCIMQEFRWEDRKPVSIQLIPVVQ
ncbi:MAG: hypothetical protein IKH27_11540 [Oscillospiraceae bacterium]|nr:hypothetical protein [Oscillospiraceae bacterium]MBR3448424.1 hypothetical protein [Oscillospiraceae bacterium]